MLGMEMMVKGLLASAGTTPEEIIAQIKSAIAYAQSVDTRMARIETMQVEILNLLKGATVEQIEAPSSEIGELSNGIAQN